MQSKSFGTYQTMVILPSMRLLSFFLLLFSVLNLRAQHQETDLSKRWFVFDHNRFVPVNKTDKKFQAIHFTIQATEGTGGILKISYTEPITILVNNTLLYGSKKRINTSIDSLRTLLGTSALQISVYHKNLKVAKLSSVLLTPNLIADGKTQRIKSTSVSKDFVIVSVLLITVLLLAIIILNSKLASDYFSVTKLISVREREESQVYNRIAGSSNFLFFGFSALTIALVLTLSKPFVADKITDSISFNGYILYWVNTTALLLSIVFAKMILTYFWAWLFDVKEVAGLQFFNWIRALFLLSGLCLLCVSVSMVVYTPLPGWINFWLSLLLIGILLWNFPIAFKVANKVHLGLFHLFSYLWVTEIIPSIIIFKILYY
ncbi:MAG: DUF4271 domain-containing protein [Chryseotalea sp.]